MTAASEKFDQLIEQVKQQQMFLEMLVRSWADDYRGSGGSIHCGRGCRNCCSLAVHTGFAEALAVARRIDEAQAKKVESYAVRLRDLVDNVCEFPQYLRLHRQIGFCPFLDDDGTCSVYSVRPLTCRALISTQESTWCGADFSTVMPEEREAFLAGLDRKVVAFPSHYVATLQDSGKELEEAGAQNMRLNFGFALYGNLGVMVHLIRNGLAEACLRGPAEAARFVSEAGFGNPLFLTGLPA